MKTSMLVLCLLPLLLHAAELPEKTTLFEVARHLYRWHMDETHIEGMIRNDEVVFFLRPVEQELDPEDRSQVVEVLLGGTGFGATLKKADYAIPELDTVVKNDTFQIIHVFRYPENTVGQDGVLKQTYPYREVVTYLFETRNTLTFPGEEMLEKLRIAVRDPIGEMVKKKQLPLDGSPEILHLAPISPVANEMWVLWERGQILIRYASEFDLESDDAWRHPEHAISIYDLAEQVVVSLHEVPGSNAYITRDKAGRALFNCVILGKRIESIPKR